MPKICNEVGCTKQPCYNYVGMTKKFCSTHKKENMVNVRKKLCINMGCTKTPTYNFIDLISAEYCYDHKKENMVNVNSIKCVKCKIRASYNYFGMKNPVYCQEHKIDNMINVRVENCTECGTRASYNYIGLKAKYCQEHKKENMINVRSKICKQCNDTQSRIKKYEGYCCRCFVHLFPNKQISKNYKTKENYIFDEVVKLLPNNNLIITRDKTIVGGCSKRRPDLMIDVGSHWICAENDENCHKNYNITCENKRIMELYIDMANRPMVLIRFNCDKYSGGQSLFKTNKQNGLEIIRSRKEFNLRICKFVEMINKYINSDPPTKSITYEYLYYE